MDVADILRLAIIIAAIIVGIMWVYIGLRSHVWLLPLLALIWLAPVTIFFLTRYTPIIISVEILNRISLSLYLVGIYSWGGVAIAKLQALAGRKRG